jgi:cupin fold WbuC family metalloprotein
VIEGVVDVVILNDSGMVESIVELGQPGTGLPFYYRLAAPQFHTLLLRTPWLVVHEITTGPFRPEQTVLAPFAPAETEVAAVASYRASLAMHVAHLRR